MGFYGFVIGVPSFEPLENTTKAPDALDRLRLAAVLTALRSLRRRSRELRSLVITKDASRLSNDLTGSTEAAPFSPTRGGMTSQPIRVGLKGAASLDPV